MNAVRSGVVCGVIAAGWLASAGVASGAQSEEPEEAPKSKAEAAREMAKAKAEKKRAVIKLKEIFKNEPSIKDVQRAVVKFYRMEPDRINRMARNSRVKALIPEFEFGLDNSVGKMYSNTKDALYQPSSLAASGAATNNPIDANPNGFREQQTQSSDNLLWRVRAVWSLDRLVFNSEELDVKSLTSIEENLVREVTTLYFSRRRQIAQMLISPPEDEEEQVYERLKLDELSATLDALTGGYFAQRAYHWED
jgi:hypothetical protein